MKVGDYVRTDDRGIRRIGKIIDDIFYRDEEDNLHQKGNLIESNPNIIDLIERFDLVNGHLVICKMYEDEKDIPTIIKCVGDYYFKEEDIKSIVTKEQFESMEYKVGE